MADCSKGDVSTAAARVAETLLSSTGDRWLHVRSVAMRADELSAVVTEPDHDILVAAAWLHDIGYGPTVRVSGLHQLDGARYLEASGYPRRVVCLVAHHSAARYEAEQRGMARELAEYEVEESPVMDALVTADMTTGPAGQPLTFDERMAEILVRYSPDSDVHRAMTNARPVLAESVRRTRQRLADVGHAVVF